MVSAKQLGGFAVFEGLPRDVLDRLADGADPIAFEIGDFIVHQHDEAVALYILDTGAVDFLIRAEGVDDLYVGSTGGHGAIVGWSIAREPHRHTASVRCTEPCRTIRIKRSAVEAILREDPRSGYRILQRIAEALAERLESARDLLVSDSRVAGPAPRS